MIVLWLLNGEPQGSLMTSFKSSLTEIYVKKNLSFVMSSQQIKIYFVSLIFYYQILLLEVELLILTSSMLKHGSVKQKVQSWKRRL